MYTLLRSVIGDSTGFGRFPEFTCLDSVSITEKNLLTILIYFIFTSVLDKCIYKDYYYYYYVSIIMKEKKEMKRIRSAGSHLKHNYKEGKFGFTKIAIDKKITIT